MTVLILTISCLKFRLATHLKWVKEILVSLCVMSVEKALLPKRPLFFSHHAMVLKKSFNCDQCDKVFQLKKGLDEHKSTIQLVEVMHQFTDKRLSRSNYFVKDINSDIQGESLLKGINHINT